MDIETAEKIFNAACKCKVTECANCILNDNKISCEFQIADSARTIIAARDQRIEQIGDRHILECERLQKEIYDRDQRIAEMEKEIKALRTCIIDRGAELGVMEKERDEARRDAYAVAVRIVNIYQLQRGARADIYEYYRAAMEVAEKYKDAK